MDAAQWGAAMLADMRHEAGETEPEALHSIFFGGGTPSLMPPALVGELIAEAERLWGFSDGIEITLEANPSSVEAENFAGLAAAGVNRVSLGLQSLHDDALQFLGRLHSASEGLAALETAQEQFARVSFDLIYARPGQTMGEWGDELSRALALGTQHISLYQLTVEPNTRFATDLRLGQLTMLEDDPASDLFTLTRDMTASAGLPAYEISNHAKPGEESRHNLTYWRYEDYCGIGPGAHGRRGGKATLRHRKPENWLSAVARNGHGAKEVTPLAAMEQAAEALLMGLRLREGVDLAAMSRRFGLTPEALVDPAKLELYRGQGLCWQDGARIGVTDSGMPVLDALLEELVAGPLVNA